MKAHALAEFTTAFDRNESRKGFAPSAEAGARRDFGMALDRQPATGILQKPVVADTPHREARPGSASDKLHPGFSAEAKSVTTREQTRPMGPAEILERLLTSKDADTVQAGRDLLRSIRSGERIDGLPSGNAAPAPSKPELKEDGYPRPAVVSQPAKADPTSDLPVNNPKVAAQPALPGLLARAGAATPIVDPETTVTATPPRSADGAPGQKPAAPAIECLKDIFAAKLAVLRGQLPAMTETPPSTLHRIDLRDAAVEATEPAADSDDVEEAWTLAPERRPEDELDAIVLPFLAIADAPVARLARMDGSSERLPADAAPAEGESAKKVTLDLNPRVAHAPRGEQDSRAAADDRSREARAERPAPATLQAAQPQVIVLDRPAPMLAPLSQPSSTVVAVLADQQPSAAPVLNADLGVSATATPANTLKIQLQPVELGIVNATLRLEDGKLTVEIEVEKPEALGHLKADRDAIERALRSAGIDVGDLRIQQAPSTLAQNQNNAQSNGQRDSQGAFAQNQQASGQSGGQNGSNGASGGQRDGGFDNQFGGETHAAQSGASGRAADRGVYI